ncbi:glutamate--tRNA ligase [Mycoplasmopsis phocirhinis]|uniref:Glutamate--tRNA ligase n=1 Tax=Mycoplasmopsis phocirhinis TaxID=142650 RepID=A0A4P6MMZ0_9BACT|nr:glutamate--tRNA ligase [Mycoplasmopsis phocirhinis]QBF34908.1 glutamate--tRNA ligase [Mycoplasmopsis phocirhinis]
MDKKIRTRYAPSPTGYLHIGGARTALFSYLFAKHFNGEFIFRLEDTDVKRNVSNGEKSQLENLEWLGIIPDESPFKPNPNCGKYRQSEKLDRYKEIAQYLLNKGLAYKAYDNSDELQAQHLESDAKGIASFKYNKNWLKLSDEEKNRRDQNGEYSIRLSMPENIELSWNDIVRGKISFDSSDIGDWVIVKSDGYPTYNFAVVIDDHDMQISHVLRGEEHITNTPKQIYIYQILGWKQPDFGHLTVITNMEGKKLSKRDTTLKQFIEDYRNEGYVPEAVFNFLTLLGWTSHDATELMSKEEIITKFNPQRLSKSPSKFDVVKMHWFSKQYFKKIDNSLIAKFINISSENNWTKLFIETFKENVGTISELKNHLFTYQNAQINPDFNLREDEIKIAKEFFTELKNLDFSIQNIQIAIENVKQKLSINGKKLFMPIRKAATFAEHGPELAKAIYLFGKDIIYERLKIWK